ncbi:hypothetical protein T484DRAFT_1823894 [Baffinella frigidus]|nr:hypothetical protein T484DRAFT_1823894 [Cryptophyta sp. CCMP2293]
MGGDNPCSEVSEECCSMSVPNVGTKGLGLFCLLANIFFPGIGSIVAGLKTDKPSTMIIGLFQFITSWLIVGWIWSIVWGWLIWCNPTT